MTGAYHVKAANLGLWLTGAVLVWAGWIFLDMSKPLSASSSAGGSAVMSTVMASKVPVLVEFHAEWCGPCRAVGPVVEELARELSGSGKARVVRIDVDKDPQAAAAHGVRGIPAFIVFQNGRETARQTGAIPKALMRQMLGL